MTSHLARVDDALRNAHIVVVDDQPANLVLIETTLRQAGYTSVATATSAHDLLSSARVQSFDLIILDLHMPTVDGFEVLERLRALQTDEATRVPILVVTADATAASKQRALAAGAKDFLTKPVDLVEVLLRTRNLLEARLLALRLKEHNAFLEERVRDRTTDLERAKLEILDRLARAAEYRDDVTGRHIERVGRLSGGVAAQLELAPADVELISQAAPLHDVGKIGVPDAILLKPARLTDDEFDVVKSHTRIGENILSGSAFPLLQMAEMIALTHHERWDGSGYPRQLSREEIPLCGRIVSVADVYDALVNSRPYKKAWTHEQALDEIVRQRGRQFDPAVVDAFVEVTDAVSRGWLTAFG